MATFFGRRARWRNDEDRTFSATTATQRRERSAANAVHRSCYARRMGARLALVALAVGGLVLSSPAAADQAPEGSVKAELVERFVRFTDWDPADLPATEFVVCIVGTTPMTPYLEKIAKGRKLQKRRAVVVSLSSTDDVVDCQLVVIAGNDRQRLRSVLTRTDGRPILTVTEVPSGAAMGATISLYIDAKLPKFDVNASAAKDSGLKLRAKLLSRAAHVVRRGKDD